MAYFNSIQQGCKVSDGFHYTKISVSYTCITFNLDGSDQLMTTALKDLTLKAARHWVINVILQSVSQSDQVYCGGWYTTTALYTNNMDVTNWCLKTRFWQTLTKSDWHKLFSGFLHEYVVVVAELKKEENTQIICFDTFDFDSCKALSW